MSDWTREFLKVTFREWANDPDTLTPKLTELADRVSDGVFQSYWDQLRTRMSTWFFHQPYFYRRGGDVWCVATDLI